MADKEVNELLAQVRGTPIGDRILNYLAQRNMMPAIQRDYSGSQAFASFSYDPLDINKPGTISYQPAANIPHLSNVMLHELVHAADRQITKDALDYMRSDPRLYDALQKLGYATARPAMGERLPDRQPREEMAYRMNPKWFDRWKSYRASNVELPAWGVAESTRPIEQLDTSAPSHLNATLAQEFDILLDLANRAKKKK